VTLEAAEDLAEGVVERGDAQIIRLEWPLDRVPIHLIPLDRKVFYALIPSH
jgi:hypothetical protein